MKMSTIARTIPILIAAIFISSAFLSTAFAQNVNLVLIDSDTDQDLETLVDNAVIDPNDFQSGNYAVRADYTGTCCSASARFWIDGVYERNENIKPYALFGDNNATPLEFYGQPLPTGSFTLRAVIYSSPSGGGSVLADVTLNLSVASASAPSFSVDDVAADEGNALSFTVTRSTPTTGAYSVDYATSNGTAIAGSDYTATSGTLVFASGETTKTVQVTTLTDAQAEGGETVNLDLSNATGGATISDALGVGTISNVAPPPSFAIDDVAATEGGDLVFTITKTGSASSSFDIDYATANDGAVAPGDYASASGTLTFLAAETTKTITVSSATDALTEGNETFFVNLTTSSAATFTDAQGLGTISDPVSFPGNITLRLYDSDNEQIINSALADTDFIDPTLFSAGQNYGIVAIYPPGGVISVSFDRDNGAYTHGEGTAPYSLYTDNGWGDIYGQAIPANGAVIVLKVQIKNSASVVIDERIVTLTVGSPPPTAPSFSIDDVAADEGNQLTFTVTRSTPTTGAFSVDYATSNGTAIEGSDYTATSGTLAFASGETTKTVQVSTLTDASAEGSETVNLDLSNATGGATISDALGVGTVNNVSSVIAALSTSPGLSILEGDVAAITITRTGSTAQAETIWVETADIVASAVGGVDYNTVARQETFAAGESDLTVNIQTYADASFGGAKAFNFYAFEDETATVASGADYDAHTAVHVTNDVSITGNLLTDYTFDELGRLITVNFDGGQVMKFDFDPAGNRSKVRQGGAPDAQSDSVTTPKNVTKEFYPLLNDEDLNDDPLFIINVTDGSAGTAEITNGGQWLAFTPNSNVVGADNFTYTITDGVNQATANVTIDVVDTLEPAPVAIDDVVAASEDTLEVISVPCE